MLGRNEVNDDQEREATDVDEEVEEVEEGE